MRICGNCNIRRRLTLPPPPHPNRDESVIDVITSKHDTDGMARERATIYLDADIRAATKLAAAARKTSESDVVEEALRQYLQTDEGVKARAEILEIMERVWARSTLTEDEAVAIANEELHAMRAEQDQQA